jgi:D-3-phosphoglycerate dehydrogenase
MKGYKVLVTPRSFRRTPGQHWERLREAGLEVLESPSERPLREEELLSLVGDVDAMIVGLDEVTRRVIEAAKSLRIIAKYGVGVDNIDLEAAAERGITVTYTPGANAPAVAELAWGLILALARHIVTHHLQLKGGSLARRTGRELWGKTLGIIGLGNIGREVAKRAKAFEMRVLAYDPYLDQELAREYGAELCPLERVLSESDIISLHCPLTPETEGIIGPEELELMKEGALLINTARKGLVDEVALYKALKEGRLGGAAFDTFEEEADLESPLLELENFLASPHAGAATYESILRMADLAASEVVRALEGQTPLHPVNIPVRKSS